MSEKHAQQKQDDTPAKREERNARFKRWLKLLHEIDLEDLKPGQKKFYHKRFSKAEATSNMYDRTTDKGQASTTEL